MSCQAYPLAACLTFRRQIEAFRLFVYPEIHPLQMLVFIEVINSPAHTVSVNYVKQLLKISQSSASRHCRILTAHASPSKEGYGMCEWVSSPTDFRSKTLQLTAKGVEAAEAIGTYFRK